MNGREGDHLLVNGQQNPVLTVAPGSTYRFRHEDQGMMGLLAVI